MRVHLNPLNPNWRPAQRQADYARHPPADDDTLVEAIEDFKGTFLGSYRSNWDATWKWYCRELLPYKFFDQVWQLHRRDWEYLSRAAKHGLDEVAYQLFLRATPIVLARSRAESDGVSWADRQPLENECSEVMQEVLAFRARIDQLEADRTQQEADMRARGTRSMGSPARAQELPA